MEEGIVVDMRCFAASHARIRPLLERSQLIP